MAKGKPRLTKEQKAALDDYHFCIKLEDRYMGSVFVNPQGQRKYEAQTKAAYARCVALGLTAAHGLW